MAPNFFIGHSGSASWPICPNAKDAYGRNAISKHSDKKRVTSSGLTGKRKIEIQSKRSVDVTQNPHPAISPSQSQAAPTLRLAGLATPPKTGRTAWQTGQAGRTFQATNIYRTKPSAFLILALLGPSRNTPPLSLHARNPRNKEKQCCTASSPGMHD